MMRCILTIVFIMCFVAASFGAEGKHDNNTTEMDLDEFNELFFTEPHIQNCAEVLDNLRVNALKNIYEGFKSMIGASLSEGKTSSGIFMVYTITHEAGSFYHEFSVSRSPYFATAFGRCMVGMACERFGLPDLTEIKVSPRRVYHAKWILSSDEQATFIAEGVPEMPDHILELSFQGLARTTSIELKKLDIDYEAIENK